MNRYLTAPLALLVLAVQLPVSAGVGDIDPAYGNGGRIAFAEDTSDLVGTNSVLPLADGRALLPIGTGYGRIDAAGRADGTFGNQGTQAWPGDFRPNWDAWLRLADGSTLLGGELFVSASFDQARSSPAVVRLDASGRIDPAFAGNGMLLMPPTTMSAGRTKALALEPDGRLLVLVHEFHYLYFYGQMEADPWNALVRRFDLSLAKDPGFGRQGEVLVYATGNLGGGPTESVVGLPTGFDGQKLTVLKDGLVRIRNDSYDGISPMPAVHLRYLDANGTPVAQPLPDPALDASIRDWQIVSRLPDGGVLMDGFVSSSAGFHYRLFRLQADGRPDTAFGNAGSFTLDDSQGGAVTQSHVSADGRFLYLGRESSNAMSVTRILLQGSTPGRIDDSFGAQGVVRIGAPLMAKALQGVADGSVLLVTRQRSTRERLTFRLLPTPSPSPGIVSFDRAVTMYVSVPGQYRLRVTRSAGSSGAVSVNFSTATGTTPLPGNTHAAVPGQDYLPLNGQITWADGETGEKSVNLTIFWAFMPLPYRPFEIQLDNLVGATWMPFSQVTIFNTVYAVYSTLSGAVPDVPYITPVAAPSAGDTASGATSPPASNGGNNSAAPGSATTTGGAGAFDPATLLALFSAAGACAARRRRRERM